MSLETRRVGGDLTEVFVMLNDGYSTTESDLFFKMMVVYILGRIEILSTNVSIYLI